jgi:hypothetical protein
MPTMVGGEVVDVVRGDLERLVALPTVAPMSGATA